MLFTDAAEPAHKSEGEGEGEGDIFTARRWRLTGAGGGDRRSSTGCVPADDTGVLVRPREISVASSALIERKGDFERGRAAGDGERRRR